MLMLGVVPIISPPNTLRFINHIRTCNWLWQEDTIGRWHYAGLCDSRTDAVLFLDQEDTKHSILDPTCATPYGRYDQRVSAGSPPLSPPGPEA